MAGQPTLILTRTIHVWYIYLHLVDLFMVNVGKYTIHGCYGNVSPQDLFSMACFFIHRWINHQLLVRAIPGLVSS